MIALVGSGEYLPGMETVDRFLLDALGQNPQVACLPTAAGTEGPDRIAYWSDLGVDHFRSLGASASAVSVITRQDSESTVLAAQVREANFVYLSGGRPDYLLATLKGSRVWQSILEVLGRGGVLAGCSAGAMILGEKIPGFPRGQNAFNLLKGAVVIPHFDEVPGWMSSLIKIWIGRRRRMVGVPGYTALVVEGKTCRVVGKSSVVLWDSAGLRRYSSGESFEWRR
jgi:cyanophycinase